MYLYIGLGPVFRVISPTYRAQTPTRIALTATPSVVRLISGFDQADVMVVAAVLSTAGFIFNLTVRCGVVGRQLAAPSRLRRGVGSVGLDPTSHYAGCHYSIIRDFTFR